MELINGLGGVAGFGENFIDRNDDSYEADIDIRDTFGVGGLNFLGHNYTTISINNNGNITFGTGGLSSYTPWGMQTSDYPMIAAFFCRRRYARLHDQRLWPGSCNRNPWRHLKWLQSGLV